MSKLTRRALLGGTLALGLAACRPAQSQAPANSPSPAGPTTGPSRVQLSKLTVGLTYVPDIQFGLLYVADHKGWFTEEGLDVTLRHHGAQEKLLGALQTGDEDVVFAGGGEMLQGRSEGIAVRNFATVYQNYPVTIIVPSDSPIEKLADLKGRSIGLPGEFGENWFYTLAALSEAGLSRDDVSIESIGFTQFAALTGAKVDSVVGFRNNDVVRFNEDGFAIRTVDVAEPPLVSVGLGALDELIAERPDDLRALVRAAGRGAEFCKTNPEEAVEIAANYVPTLTEPEQQAHALAVLKATTALFGENFGAQEPARWESMAQFFAAEGLVTQPVTATEAFTTDIVEG